MASRPNRPEVPDFIGLLGGFGGSICSSSYQLRAAKSRVTATQRLAFRTLGTAGREFTSRRSDQSFQYVRQFRRLGFPPPILSIRIVGGIGRPNSLGWFCTRRHDCRPPRAATPCGSARRRGVASAMRSPPSVLWTPWNVSRQKTGAFATSRPSRPCHRDHGLCDRTLSSVRRRRRLPS